jgi:hypothetical protein
MADHLEPLSVAERARLDQLEAEIEEGIQQIEAAFGPDWRDHLDEIVDLMKRSTSM